MKKYILLLICLSFGLQVQAQKVNWVGLEEAFELQKANPKPILIDVYTEWCGWCKRMEATTYRDLQIVNYLNENFYAVKFDAETNDTLIINGKTYLNPNPTSSRSKNQYATEIGVKSFPTTIFYDKNGQNRTMAGGYLKQDKLGPILVFFSEHLFGVADINTFSKDFTRTYNPDTSQTKKVKQIKWMEINTGLAAAKAQNKKIWIQSYGRDLSSKIMDSTIYQNEYLVDYINNNYIPIKFNAFSKDTVTLQNKKFVNPNPGANSYHQLFISALNKLEIKTPSLFIFDEKEQLLAPVNSFLNVKYAEALAVYFNEGKNKEEISFGDFIKTYHYQSVK